MYLCWWYSIFCKMFWIQAKYFLDKSIFLNHLKYFSTIVGIIAQFVDLLLIGAMTIFCQNILDELV